VATPVEPTSAEQGIQASAGARAEISPVSGQQHTEILLIRHGEAGPDTPGTPAVLTDGYADPALTPRGHRQAARVADRLAATAIDAVYVTPLRRTRQTARPLAERLGLEMGIEEGLREVHLGEWEGNYRVKVAQRDPLVAEVWASERWDLIPGAEPSREFAARVHSAVRRLAEAHPGQRLAVFSHGGVIGQALADAAGSRPFAFVAPDNASISRLVVARQRWVIRSFNDTAHLAVPDVSPMTN
jgi:probable phosphoglycerate mutase